MFMRRLLSVLAAGLGFVCVAMSQEHTKDSLEQVKKALTDKKAVLIDVREKGEWDKGHLKDAKLLPLSTLQGDTLPKDLATLFPKDTIIYAHCAAGVRCVTAAGILRKAGYDVRAIKDGYKDLLQKGFPKATD